MSKYPSVTALVYCAEDQSSRHISNFGWILTHRPPSGWGLLDDAGEIKAVEKELVTLFDEANGPGYVSSLKGIFLK